MRIAIVSDIHDHVWNLAAALPHLRDVDAVLCCGDLCSPFVMAELGRGISAPVHVVFGNNDGDQYRMTRVAAGFDHMHLHGEFFHGRVAGTEVAMSHYPEVAETLDPTGLDLIAYGHDHVFHLGARGRACVVNPGPLMGWRPGEGEVAVTFAVFDTASGKAEGYRLAEDGTVQQHAP